MKFKFDNIPAEVGFSVFDYDNDGSGGNFHDTFGAGSHEVIFEIPTNWTSPHYSIAALEYFVPDSYGPLNRTTGAFIRTGEDFYLDVTRDETREEANRRSVEKIITATTRSGDLDGRQKFYVALMALNSHFEFLTHTMLVVSGHMSQREFDRMSTHHNRIDAACDSSNVAFFANRFHLCPGKEIDPGNIDIATVEQCRTIMQAVRKTRNDVAHGWGYNDLSNEQLTEFFEQFGEAFPYSPTEEELFKNAAFECVKLWAKVQTLNTRAMLVQEKAIIQIERESRCY